MMAMRNILTADQFVAGLISVLALKNHRHFVLKDSELDAMFEQAFEDLMSNEEALGVTANFTFCTDLLHGDSIALRDALLAAKEKELIALNNPTFHTFDIKLDEVRARQYLAKLPLPEQFFSEVVEKYFTLN